MTAILDSWGVNRDLLILFFGIIILALAVVCAIMIVTTRKLYKRYDYFMRGKDAESMEDMVRETHTKMFSLQDQEMENRDRIKRLQFGVNQAYQKTGVVHYNAFEGMGGQSSFVLALLDSRDNGFLLNAMHSRTSCYTYIKEIKEGKPDTALGAEEQEALNKALGK